ncbi:MAG: DUF2141 domain-containing protein [Bryobacter sp.]|nr:DUF2141 domain-containing protein [Bryobacter sp.]
MLTMLMLLWAADITVEVKGIKGNAGEIGCALFAGPEGFPVAGAKAQTQWQKAKPEGVSCVFPNVASGTYAVSVSHDENGNRKTDTKMFGIPTEAWGVSNNVRFRMRPPKFAEAAFVVEKGKNVRLAIEVAK